jgi:hypothetical protein
MARNRGHLSPRIAWQQLLAYVHSILPYPTVYRVYPIYSCHILFYNESRGANMATKRARKIHDYNQLNSLSSVVLWDTAPRLKKAKTFYEVEREITRRRIHLVSIYLLTYFQISMFSSRPARVYV